MWQEAEDRSNSKRWQAAKHEVISASSSDSDSSSAEWPKGSLTMATRKPFSKEDTIHVVDWLARNNPNGDSRRGTNLWKQLMTDSAARPWNNRHTWQSWREKYIENIDHFDALINKKLRSTNGVEVAPGPSPRRLKDARDLKSLADYFVARKIPENIRSRADISHELRHSELTKTWARTRSAMEWRDFYDAHKLEVDKMVLEETGGTQDGPAQQTTSKTAKRPREEEGQATARENGVDSRQCALGVSTNGVKKRRIEAPRPEAPRSPMINGPEPLTPPPDIDPVVFVPETPPSVQPTPLATSKRLPNGTVPIMPKTSVLNAIASGFSKVKYGQYGVPGSPLGSQVPPASPEPKNATKANGIAKSIFPQSLPSLTPALREKTMSRETMITPRQGVIPTVEVVDTTPEAPRDATKAKENSIFAQVGQETPRNGADHSRQEIFPHTLPHLTPALRPGPHGENEYIINEDSVVFASQNEHEDNNETLFPSSVPNLTPALRPGPHGETSYIIRDGSIQFLDVTNGRLGTPEQNALDDDEFEGPSPMPYLGSDRHSSRSYSHGDETLTRPLIEGLAKALAGQSSAVDEAYDSQIDELEEDDESIGKAPSPKRLPPAESPVFASSSEDEAEDKGKGRRQLQQVKTRKIGHQPIKAQPKATRASARKSTEMDTDSESDLEAGSDKENGTVVESQAPIDVNDVFHPGHDNDAATDQMAATSLQEAVEDTPDVLVSPKPLHFSGKTPPSPSAVATHIKAQIDFNIIRPATAPPLSRGAAAIANRYGKPVLDLSTQDSDKSSLLKAALSYPSPNIPSELEEALRRKEEPSPLQRLAEKAMDRARAVLEVGNTSDAGKVRHGKVRFDGVAIDRDRRKTTGGIGMSLSTGARNGIVSDAVAGPSHSRFKAAPAIFGSQRRTASHEIHLDRKKEDIIELDDEEDEEESPLARYTARATSSPQKSTHETHDRNRRSSSHEPIQARRSTAAKFPPPPPPVQVPIYISSSSPLPRSSPPARSTDRKERPGTTSTRKLGTALWSPVRFGQPSAPHVEGGEDYSAPLEAENSGARVSTYSRGGLHMESGDIPSIDYRDQETDAAWVSAVYGRPSITSTQINPRGRSAPIPSDGDVVVFSSRSPSRSRTANKRPSTAGYDNSGLEALSIISQADQRRVLDWLEENRNPDLPLESDEEEDEGASRIFEGLGLMFEKMAANNGFAASVPRNVWKQCGDLNETAVVVQEMTDAANSAGLKILEARQKKHVQEAMESREAVLSGEVDGRRKSGRYSANVSRDITTPKLDETNAGRDPTSGARSSRDGYRPRPPSYVPAEVVEPLLSQP